ncbi:DUF2997 domain-containing protein [Thermodesulfobacteriota bacterium]
MKRKEIVFTIDKNGGVTTTVEGIKGSSCTRIAEAFKSLGKVIREKRTSEYFENNEVSTLVKGTTGISE